MSETSGHPSLWFVVPAAGRHALTRACLRQLARTCEALTMKGVQASAVVVAEDENAQAGAECGFDVVQGAARPLGAKFNDGFAHAAAHGADFVMPCGSDNWIDPKLILAMVERATPGTIAAARLCAMVNEDGSKLARLRIPYAGGIGLRLLPAALLAPLGWRPVAEDRSRAIDTDMLGRLRAEVVYRDLHPLQIVDFKSPSEQLNSYEACAAYRLEESGPPWGELSHVYPVEAVEEVQAVYRERVLA